MRRVSTKPILPVSAGLLALILLLAPGCKKQPAVVVPDLEEALIEQTSDPEGEMSEESPTVEPEELGTSPADTPEEAVVETPEQPEAPATERPAKSKPAPPPARPAEPEPAEEETAKPRLFADRDTPGKVELQEKLAAAEELLDRLERRSLSDEQAELVVAGEAFVHQAQEAFSLDDLDRTAILLEKALILLEDVEQSSRP